jgi:hypothetical protein
VKSILVITAAVCASTAFSQAIDKTKPSGRACLAIVNIANGDEEALRPTRTAGKNQKIVAHLDATAGCEVLVAPFVKSEGLVTGWMPQYVSLDPGRETVAPKAPAFWNWEKDTGPLEIFVLFFAPGSKKGSEIRELVNAVRKATGASIIKLQGGKLRELIASANFDKEAARRAPKAIAEVAGQMRMVMGFEWRDSARVVNFSAETPGALVFPLADVR